MIGDMSSCLIFSVQYYDSALTGPSLVSQRAKGMFQQQVTQVAHSFLNQVCRFVHSTKLQQLMSHSEADRRRGRVPCQTYSMSGVQMLGCGGLRVFYRESLLCVGEPLGVVVRIVSHSLFDVTLYLAGDRDTDDRLHIE